MKLLLKTALRYKRTYSLVALTLVSMVMLTISSQLEMFSLGIVTNRGVDFFKLFHDHNEKTQNFEEARVSREQMEKIWPLIDTQGHGEIRKTDALRYMARYDKESFFQNLVARVDKSLGFSQNVLFLVSFLVAVAAIKALAFFFQGYTTSLVSIRVSQQMRQDYFDHIQTLPMSFYNHYNIGSLSTRVAGDAGTIAQAINSLLTNYFQTPLTLLSTLFLLYKISPPLFMLIFFGLPVLVIPIIILTKRVKHISRIMQTRREQFAHVLYEFLAGIQTIKSFAMEAFSSQKYSHHNNDVVSLEEKSTRYGLLLRPILHFLGTLFLSVVILWGFYIAKLNLSEILLFCGLLYVAYEPVKKFAEENMRIQLGVVAAERLYEVLSIKPDIQDSPTAKTISHFERTIEFKDVWFRYHENQEWVLKDFNLTLKRGDFVALVGPTGCGKSTLVQLLLRLYEVQKGDILIDGISIKEIKQSSLRGLISSVPQKPFLFLDTIAANISFGKARDEEKLKHAAQRAMAYDFISALPMGFDTEIKETGKDLSGGQQQRLAIARALYRESPILVLDEATSALDVITEDKIKRVLQDLRSKMTQLVVAHRLSTIEAADKIVYIEKGVKLAEGPLPTLLETCQPFYHMWQAAKKAQSDLN
jgi:ABC-type multidrug transport system fused ATPase/permease subunit